MSKRRATEVVAARGRLKGALQDIANVTEDESEADSSKPSRGRPPKRVKKESTPPPQPKVQHSFIMKLFDRCVDLAKYTEGTPLYPICRAWMLNQPKSSQLTNYKLKSDSDLVKRNATDAILDDLKNDKITEVSELPPSADTDLSRIPTPLFELNSSHTSIDLDYDLESPRYDRKELLAELKGRCARVRKNWIEHTTEYEQQKYSTNFQILELLYKK